MRPTSSPSALLALALVLAVGADAAVAVAADTPEPAPPSCFQTRDWDGWTAPGDGDALLLKVGTRDIYRVELTPGSRVRKLPDNFLVNRVRGSSRICKAIDLDLALTDHNGFSTPLIAVSLRKLSPEEVAALPPKDRP